MMSLEEAALQLEDMQLNPLFITESVYSPTAFDFPNRILPFVEVHMGYLRRHKQVDPAGYISNLRIMIKRRG